MTATRTADNAGQTPSGTRRVISAGLVAGVAAAIWAVWTQSSAGSNACRADRFPSALQFICADADRSLSVDSASRFAIDYLDEYSDSDPAGAWDMLDSDYRDKLERPDYNADAKTLLWAEPVGAAVDAPGFNKFSVVWRFYARPNTPGGSHVTTLRETITLKRSGDDVVMTGQKVTGKAANTAYLAFPRVNLMRAYDPRQLPRSTSDATLHVDPAGLSGDIQLRGQLTALCNVEVTGRPPGVRVPGSDRGWWTRTPQGWLPSRVLAEDPNQPLNADKIAGIPDCDGGPLTR